MRALCSIGGCERTVVGRGWCDRHWRRWRKHGDPLGGQKDRAPRGEALAWMKSVAVVYTGDECLPWPYCLNGGDKGYPCVWVDGRLEGAHRWICTETNGPRPTPEHQAAHSCGQSNCVAPRHLRWATPIENMADARRHGTIIRGERSSRAKLTEGDVLSIRDECTRRPQRSVANDYGVSESVVSNIVHGKTWTHLAEAA